MRGLDASGSGKGKVTVGNRLVPQTSFGVYSYMTAQRKGLYKLPSGILRSIVVSTQSYIESGEFSPQPHIRFPLASF